MRKATLLFAGALFISSSAAVLAQDAQSQRNECLLASRNCKEQVDDIYKRMERLNKEIHKGTRVYSQDELRRLQQKLDETQELLRDMEKPGH